jgi:anti-sigma regulatory factor (Ser/Thr protein kinase)/N-acetylglutamate synthase-like GNAT family acetyltransferase
VEKRVVLRVISDRSLFPIIKSTVKKSLKSYTFSKDEVKNTVQALKELFENSILHAYQNEIGYVEISLSFISYGVKIELRDFGTPMSSKKYESVNLDNRDIKGFNRVFQLVDKFEYRNDGKKGKVFTIYKYSSCAMNERLCNIQNPKNYPKLIAVEEPLVGNVVIRDFHEDDEDGIAKLIYQNYGYSYIKELFYNPQEILRVENQTLFSIVAEIGGELVGHFTIIKLPDSNIAEIGVAVVSPKSKGHGIMNKMFARVLERAKELKLDAIFGEALMYHQFSQKANIKHGFVESCFQLGKVLKDVVIENNSLSQIDKRGSVLIGYKFLKKQRKRLYLPEKYRDQIIQIYQQSDEVSFSILPKTVIAPLKTRSKIRYELNGVFNIATIIIDRYGSDFETKFQTLFYHLRIKHVDMIYVHINLEQIPQIDRVVEILNGGGFFFGGTLFLMHNGMDYLHMQYKNSSEIGSKNFICYSDFCKELVKLSQDDEKIWGG